MRLAAILMIALAACSFRSQTKPMGDDAAVDAAPDAPPVPSTGCAALPTPAIVTRVANVNDLRMALATGMPGDTIVLADGVYDVAGTGAVLLSNPGTTLRSESGDASKVIIDGGLAASPVVSIIASDVTLTAITIAHAATVGVLVQPSSVTITGVRIHDVTFVDAGGPAIRIAPAANNVLTGPYADDGTIACSRFVDTPNGADHCTPNQLGIEGNGVSGWTLRDSLFQNVRCDGGYNRNIVFRSGSRDTRIIGNVIRGSPSNIMFGTSNGRRTYSGTLPVGCSGIPDHLGGIVCNNVIDGLQVPSVPMNTDFEEGVALWSTCDAWIVHNTIASPTMNFETYHDIEYRFVETFAHLVNNLLAEPPASRDGATQDSMYAGSNRVYQAADFVDPAGGDFHLRTTAVAQGISIAALPPAVLEACSIDLEGRMRDPAAPDPGAYERR